jgi:hypothetical protein
MLVRCTEIAPTAGMLAIRGAVPDIAFVAALTIIAAVILSMLFWVFVSRVAEGSFTPPPSQNRT